ncbi:hypothetical protein JMM81_04700 [Bacillus sp. V3B]|uniref:hypothetical protein n=1 Tax=Bacillus sp. V3B TaxID=2804915 RepID=UPI00210EF032|nr:hypothetical protein [Bacillus sp. V3B]MCQ6274275.1 hypothetical protein [Bacillus sp. V3B]
MKKEELFDAEANEANMELSEKMNGDSPVPHGSAVGEENSTTEANLKIQEAFYGEKNQDEVAPTYLNHNTPAIKITGNNE